VDWFKNWGLTKPGSDLRQSTRSVSEARVQGKTVAIRVYFCFSAATRTGNRFDRVLGALVVAIGDPGFCRNLFLLLHSLIYSTYRRRTWESGESVDWFRNWGSTKPGSDLRQSSRTVSEARVQPMRLEKPCPSFRYGVFFVLTVGPRNCERAFFLI